jgi:hypothetical protein
MCDARPAKLRRFCALGLVAVNFYSGDAEEPNMVERTNKVDQLRAFREARALAFERAAAQPDPGETPDVKLPAIKKPTTGE